MRIKNFSYLLSSFYVIGIIILLVTLGFVIPREYNVYINFFFIGLLLIGVVKTILKYFLGNEKVIVRVIIFDIVSILFILYCILIQIIDYDIHYVSKYLQFAVILKIIREVATPNFSLKRSFINPPQLFIISFFTLIFIGAFMLMLPTASKVPLSFLDALFTATSAVCVTGLTVVDTFEQFTAFGHFLIMLLIQMGGLGILTFAGYIAYFFKGNSSYENQIALGSIANNDALSEVFVFVKRIIYFTFAIEAIGAFLIYFSLESHSMAFLDKVFFSVFHSISAFCNAGFSTLPKGVMNIDFIYNYNFQSVLILLIFLGGIGFPILINLLKYLEYLIRKVFYNLTSKRHNKRNWVFSLSSKVNLVTSLSILGIATIILFFEEFYNTLQPHQGFGKFISAVFLAITPRTAGFNAIDFSQLHFSSIMFVILLMWIGASPASTGGGIKTSTFAIAILNFINIARGKSKIEVFKRELNPINVQKAFATMTLSFLVVGIGVFLITKFDSHLNLIDVAFEAFSAYSTVGLSLNVTPTLSDSSKVVIIIIMFIGRVSMITILMAFFKRSTGMSNYGYPSDDILI
ncbi:TrkH family potassium uptake protein [Flavobacterium sp. HSC-61S13]|uniref:TrkH family potassium uptake protein n=1 Tax=Flavobacterium sp. HSC-61S13 TaxID=2910963 RepID=UPI0020A0A9A3|nr:potassium transporter TrkG [Flavobacterium sp. HSC-61S13]MCP1994330.1 potassium uptake TrkH family protein [Flavobacterium sp. HSC-61S13]